MGPACASTTAASLATSLPRL
uniref:Uncharacterized protein n=1 Tax=Rhizophora mucronata TaxID=61149 RepID=A0A2P2N849_RHIMU